jgi:subfamily B ATP-binding cassette protein MsbA
MSSAARPVKGSQTYRRLLGYARPHWGVFLWSILGMALYASTETLFAALMKPMLDQSFVARDPEAIKLIPLALMGIFLLRGIAGFLSTYSMSWIGRTIIKTLRGEMFRQLLRLPTAYFDRTASGQLLSKLTYNVEQVSQASTNAVTIVVRDTLTALGLLGYMFYLSGTLSLVFLLAGPFIAVVVVYVSRRFRRVSTRIQDSMGEVTQITQEAIEGQREVKIFGGQDYETAHFDDVNEHNQRQQLKMVATSAISVPFIQLLAATALAGIIYMATHDSSRTITSAGTFVSFITALMLLLPPLKRLTTVNSMVQRGIAAAETIFELLDLPPEQDHGKHSVERAEGRIEYRGVRFAYRDDAEPVLKDVSFTVEPGQTVAFVGRSGSGKSTLVNLLPRFYDITTGQVLLDGMEVRDYRLASLREQVALVSQHVTLFNDTIGRNIAYGRLASSSREQIEAAAEAAHALDFIRELPQGLDTLVGENGLLLSGGQRQRIAIARAILRNAPVLILDEATSALDAESEFHVQAGLEQLMRGRTTLVIAHRLSTVEKADRIIVLDEGRLVESGTHQELLAKGGHYAMLYGMQFRDAGASV